MKETIKIAGISATTARVWGKELFEVLSDGANPPRGTSRHYTQDDAIIFHTAKVLKSEGQSWEQIIESIKSGERVFPSVDHNKENEPIPHSSDVVPLSFFERIVNTLSSERDNLRNDLETERRKHEETRNNLLEATEQATEYRTRAEMLRDQLDELNQDKFVRYDPNQYGQEPKKRWWEFWKD